eukprot:TRINITY_DN13410_c0_g1_i5.p1 TRINITY_DN13410_c0_g1~~TRINITY_DN13410_c0_g1_i5.p1  ORF type:complete len:752 (+),score=122.32 TRINITY_DN13410_c0_g1_i5:436-2691(+)
MQFLMVVLLVVSLLNSVASYRSERSVTRSSALSPSGSPQSATYKPTLGPSHGASLPPKYRGFALSPRRTPLKHHGRKRHVLPPSSFAPSHDQGCEQITCSDPLTSTPIGSPCGCVYPMQVELDLGVAPFAVFPLVPELEIEIAAGTYLKQSQVRIMGATANSLDQGKTTVNIDLVPLGEKFDSTTARLTYERFWLKKVQINMTLFGDYSVVYVRYPGLPSSPPYVGSMGIGPSGGGSSVPGNHERPFMANVINKGQKMNARTVVLISFSSFVLFLMCVGVLFSLLKFKRLGRPSSTVGPAVTSSITKRSGIKSILSSSVASSMPLSLTSTMATCMLSVKTFTLAELGKATDKFSSDRILGEGGFGRVYHGIMEDGSEAAVKLLRRDDQSGDREFIVEVEMLSRLHHRNLVELIGICIEDHTRCLVYEVVRNGSVESHLHGIDKRKGSLDWDARMKIALGAARGLAYLHEDSNPRVIHRDFKASNILLEDDFTPKVSDFGLAREASEGSQHISTRVMGTFGYVAPEYAMTGHLLVKSDVYSYGVVLLELLSGRKPVDMSQPQGQENLVTWARPLLTTREGLEQLVDPSLCGNYNFDNMAKVAAIALMCVHPEVTQRPFMGEVVQALKLVYNDMDETCGDSCSQKESSLDPDCGFGGDLGADSSWWNGSTPRLTYAYSSPYVTMEYCSGPLEQINRPVSESTIVGGARSLTRHNRSGPLRKMRSRLAFYRLKGSMSEHGFFSRHLGMDRYYWV